MKCFKMLLLYGILLMGFTGIAFANHEIDTAKLSWTAGAEPDLAGYKVYSTMEAGVYGVPQDVGNITQLEMTLEPGTWFFAVTAYDTSDNESDLSNVVSKTILVIPGDHTAPLPPTLSIIEELAKALNHIGNALTMLVQDNTLKVE